jgi:protein TonB
MPVPVVPVRPIEKAQPRPDSAPRPMMLSKRPRERPREAAAPPPTEPAPPSTIDDRAAAESASGGAVAGTMGGTRTGIPGGTVGGLGTQPLTLRDVASPPEIVTRVVPDYPPLARQRGVEGQVVLEAILDRDGRIEDRVRVIRSIPLLDDAAVAAVKAWRFRPARDPDGRSVRVIMEIPVRFVLR